MDKDLKKPKIVIFGGGIAGLTVAHECIEAGMDVDLYEQHAYCGGKALCLKNSEGLYVEHGFRVYPSTYVTLLETLKRIPYENSGHSVYENLVPAEGLHITSFNHKIIYNNSIPPDRIIDASFSASKIKNLIIFARSLREWGLPWKDVIYFFWVLLQPMIQCDDRKQKKLYQTSFREYCQLDKRSKAFAHYLTFLAQIPALAKPEASAIVMLDILCRSFFVSTLTNPNSFSSAEYLMNGPTSERFINPWVKQLEKLGVKFHLNQSLDHLVVENGSVQKAILKDGRVVQADAYVSAVSYPVFKKRIAPLLKTTTDLSYVLCFGIQVFLKKPLKQYLARKIGIALESPWGLAYWLEGVSPTWENVPLRSDVNAILSITLSDTEQPGSIHKRPATECSWQEVKEEIIHQMGLHDDLDSIVDITLDPTARCLSEEEYQKHLKEYEDWVVEPPTEHGYRWLFETHAFECTPATLPNIPKEKTDISNLFLAGEFVYNPHMMVANMERTNWTGKQCAKCICDYFNLPYDDARLRTLNYPLGWVRKIDALFYRFLNFH